MPERELTFENEFTYADGTSGWFELRVQPVPAGLFILSIDITARVEAERSMARQLARLRSLREIFGIVRQFLADCSVISSDIVAIGIDQVQQDRRPFDMTQELIA